MGHHMSLRLETPQHEPWTRIWTCDTCKTQARTPHDTGPLYGDLEHQGWTFTIFCGDHCPNCPPTPKQLDLLDLLERAT